MAVKKKATKKVAKTTKKAAKKATKKVAKTTKKVAKKATKKVAKKAAPKKATAKKVTKKVAKKAAPKKATTKKAAPKKATAKKAAPKKATKKAAPKKKTARKPNAAFMRPLTPSSQLAVVIGGQPLPRTQAVKKIWDYIKKHNLQNPKNKRNILADDKLKPIFGKNEVTMFELTSLVSKHLN